MNKEEFLNKLRAKLEVLEESEVEDIINEYSEHIDEKVKKKISEEEAIKEFGDIDELVSGILSAYKVNQDFAKKNKDSFVEEFIDNCKQVFDKLIKIVSHGSVKEVMYLCVYILIILLILLIIRIPFEIIESGIDSIIYNLPEMLFRVFNVLKLIVINVIYFALSAVVFVKILKEKLLDGINFVYEEKEITVNETKRSNKKDKVKSSDNEEKVIIKREEHTKIKYKNERTFLDSIGDLLKVVCRSFAFLISLPFVAGVVCFAICLSLVVMFCIEYKFFMGPMLAIIGCLLFCIVLSELLVTFAFKKEIKFTRLFITFIVSLVLSGLGVGYSLFEVSTLEFKSLESSEKVLLREDLFEYNNEKINCYDCSNVLIEIDDTLANNEIKVKAYSYEYYEIIKNNNSYSNYDEGVLINSGESIDYFGNLNITRLINRIKKDLKNNELYDYDGYRNIELIIYTNSSMYDFIKKNVAY